MCMNVMYECGDQVCCCSVGSTVVLSEFCCQGTQRYNGVTYIHYIHAQHTYITYMRSRSGQPSGTGSGLRQLHCFYLHNMLPRWVCCWDPSSWAVTSSRVTFVSPQAVCIHGEYDGAYTSRAVSTTPSAFSSAGLTFSHITCIKCR